MTFVLGVGVGVSIALIQMQTVHAQTNATVQVPITVPNLKFTPALPAIEAEPRQQNTGVSVDGELTAIITSIVVTAIGVISSKMHSDKKSGNIADVVKVIIGEVLKGKEVDKELARVTYKMNETEANKITDAPAVKVETLNEDAKDFTQKIAKESSKLPA